VIVESVLAVKLQVVDFEPLHTEAEPVPLCHPSKSNPAAGLAVKVTLVPEDTEVEHMVAPTKQDNPILLVMLPPLPVDFVTLTEILLKTAKMPKSPETVNAQGVVVPVQVELRAEPLTIVHPTKWEPEAAWAVRVNCVLPTADAPKL